MGPKKKLIGFRYGVGKKNAGGSYRYRTPVLQIECWLKRRRMHDMLVQISRSGSVKVPIHKSTVGERSIISVKEV